MQAEFVHVQTADGVRLDGALRTPPAERASTLGLDLVVCHHGVSGNFYNPSFFDDIGTRLLEQGCAVLRVNNRGHDLVYRGSRGLLGSVYEVVDDCRLDWRAWLDFAEAAGYRRVGVWGHSLGAVKTIYYLARERDARIRCAIASSPPRFAYRAYLESEDGAQFSVDMRRAQELLGSDQPRAIFEARVPLVTLFSAQTFVDKYGPDSPYDIFDQLPHASAPLLVTLGALEVDGLAFRDLARRGPSLGAAAPNVRYALVDGADHQYAGRVAELWALVADWLHTLGRPSPAHYELPRIST